MKISNKIIISIELVLLVLNIVFFISNKQKNFDYENYKFKHEYITEAEMKEGTFYNDDNSYKCYYYYKKSLEDRGKYYIAKMLYPRKTVTIEENVIENGSIQNSDYYKVTSILYSRQIITETEIDNFLNIVHLESCGATIDFYRKIKENHYYVEYYMAEDC